MVDLSVVCFVCTDGQNYIPEGAIMLLKAVVVGELCWGLIDSPGVEGMMVSVDWLQQLSVYFYQLLLKVSDESVAVAWVDQVCHEERGHEDPLNPQDC